MGFLDKLFKPATQHESTPAPEVTPLPEAAPEKPSRFSFAGIKEKIASFIQGHKSSEAAVVGGVMENYTNRQDQKYQQRIDNAQNLFAQQSNLKIDALRHQLDTGDYSNIHDLDFLNAELKNLFQLGIQMRDANVSVKTEYMKRMATHFNKVREQIRSLERMNTFAPYLAEHPERVTTPTAEEVKEPAGVA